MRIEADSVLPFPRERVFRAYRDEMVQLASYMPNVRGIETKSRSEEGSTIKMFNVWRGGGDIPAPLRAILDPKVLDWDDDATWKNDEWAVEWKIRTHAFTEAVSCGGRNTFVELPGDRTRLEIRGDISIDPKKIRGIPSFLAGSLTGAVESFLVKQITANLTTVSDALSKHLNATKG